MILLVTQIDPEQSIEAMRMGVKGIALKDSDPDVMVEGIRTILAGGYWFETNITQPGACNIRWTDPSVSTGAMTS